MSKYTIELRFLRDYMFKFDYDYYMKGLVPDEVYEKSKKEFEDKFINHYMFDEICSIYRDAKDALGYSRQILLYVKRLFR